MPVMFTFFMTIHRYINILVAIKTIVASVQWDNFFSKEKIVTTTWTVAIEKPLPRDIPCLVCKMAAIAGQVIRRNFCTLDSARQTTVLMAMVVIWRTMFTL